MALVPIHDLDDPRLAVYRHLKDTNETRREGLFVVEGGKLVERLLASRFPVVSVLLGKRWVARYAQLAPAAAPTYVVPDDGIEALIGFNFHRGVLACARRLPAVPLADLVGSRGRKLSGVVCADIQDRENLGSILRTSLALGADACLLGPQTCDPFARRVLRVSMGAVLRMPLATSTDLASDLVELRDRHGVELVATVLDPQAEPLSTCRVSDRFALLFGNEGNGLPTHLTELCQRKVTIPMSADVDSLNVGVAAGVLLHGLLRPGHAVEPSLDRQNRDVADRSRLLD